jgi:uncharacterized protein (DUF1501 family)
MTRSAVLPAGTSLPSSLRVTRRGFLGGAGAAGLATTLPLSVLADAAGAAPPDADQGVLLVVFLRGGNDSLNTFGPFDSGIYQDQRQGLAVQPSQGLSAGGGHWWHPSLSYVRQRWQQGDVAVLPGVGEPDNDHSHFSSTTTWMSGRPLGENRSTGWLGRWLDLQGDDVLGASVDGGTAKQIKGIEPRVIGVSRSSGNLLPSGSREQAGNTSLWRHNHGALNDMGNQYGGALRIAAEFSGKQRPLYAEGVHRNSDRFAADLERAADLLNLGLGVRVISATLSGFDTHSDQADRHAEKLLSLDLGIRGFFDTLLPALHGQTTVLVISEFRRRLRRNNSLGTDHGSAGMAMAIGQRVKGGLKGAYPSLTDLTRRGDLKFNTDFRSLYTTVAQRWLATDGVALLGTSHDELDLFIGGPAGTGVAGFLDVDGSSFYAGALRWAAAAGVVTGSTPTTFEPGRNMTRGEFATVMWRSAGSPAPGRGSAFHDVSASAYYAEAVAWMVEQGITTGTSRTEFSPDRSLTRGEAATLLWRARGRPVRATVQQFDDVPGGRFYSDAVNWMAADGITTGTSPTRFSPHDPVDRAQAVTFLWRDAGEPAV